MKQQIGNFVYEMDEHTGEFDNVFLEDDFTTED